MKKGCKNKWWNWDIHKCSSDKLGWTHLLPCLRSHVFNKVSMTSFPWPLVIMWMDRITDREWKTRDFKVMWRFLQSSWLRQATTTFITWNYDMGKWRKVSYHNELGGSCCLVLRFLWTLFIENLCRAHLTSLGRCASIVRKWLTQICW